MKILPFISLSVFLCGCSLLEKNKKTSENNSANTPSDYSSINDSRLITRKTDVFECNELLELVEDRKKQYSDDNSENVEDKKRARSYKIKEELIKQTLFNEYKALTVNKTPKEQEKLAKVCQAIKERIDDSHTDL